jgi:hypothetical protein
LASLAGWQFGPKCCSFGEVGPLIAIVPVAPSDRSWARAQKPTIIKHSLRKFIHTSHSLVEVFQSIAVPVDVEDMGFMEEQFKKPIFG